MMFGLSIKSNPQTYFVMIDEKYIPTTDTFRPKRWFYMQSNVLLDTKDRVVADDGRCEL